MDTELLKKLRALGKLLREQDNRMTHNPIFIVQQKRRIEGYENASEYTWFDGENNVVTDADKIEELDDFESMGLDLEGYYKVGYYEYWEFVTACFTEEGCKDYLRQNRHNLGETRVYTASGYRNDEWETIRQFLMSLEES
jgi:hypothetical protein